jgi:predicted nucleic acid-binding protein
MKRVFLDANILFSAAYREESGLLCLWRLSGMELVTSDYAAQEALANLNEPAQRERLARLLKAVKVHPHSQSLPPLPSGIMLPDKDAPILQAAIGTASVVLLTGDVAHFGRYYGKTIGGVRILPPADFLRELGGYLRSERSEQS